MKFTGAQSRLHLVEAVFKEYIEVTRSFTRDAERCAKKAVKDPGAGVKDSFELQRVLIDCQALRFAHLLSAGHFNEQRLTLSDITERLIKGWADQDEKALLEANPYYRQTIEHERSIRARSNGHFFSEIVLKKIQSDPHYQKARQRVADEVNRLEQRLRAQGV